MRILPVFIVALVLIGTLISCSQTAPKDKADTNKLLDNAQPVPPKNIRPAGVGEPCGDVPCAAGLSCTRDASAGFVCKVPRSSP